MKKIYLKQDMVEEYEDIAMEYNLCSIDCTEYDEEKCVVIIKYTNSIGDDEEKEMKIGDKIELVDFLVDFDGENLLIEETTLEMDENEEYYFRSEYFNVDESMSNNYWFINK